MGMGVDINSVQFLAAARRRGVIFGEVLTLGRQDLNVFPARMRQMLHREGLSGEAFAPDAPDTKFAEGMFKALGATSVAALDMSAFEGAEFVHDLNKPIGPELKERFDLVFDGGTLEHVFHFPLAFQNTMEMLRVGGRLFIHTGTNNYCGHGFYQFSPELFFRALNADNGFQVERIVLHPMGPYGSWHEVNDPEQIRERTELITWYPLQMMVQAVRTKAVPIFATAPQQSDYTPRWDVDPATGQKKVATSDGKVYAAARPKLAKSFPGLARLFNAVKTGVSLLRSHSLRNRRAYRKVKRGS